MAGTYGTCVIYYPPTTGHDRTSSDRGRFQAGRQRPREPHGFHRAAPVHAVAVVTWDADSGDDLVIHQYNPVRRVSPVSPLIAGRTRARRGLWWPMVNPPAAFTVWADNPDTGKRLGFGFSSIEEAHAKVAQLKMAKFRAVEMIVSKLPEADPWPRD